MFLLFCFFFFWGVFVAKQRVCLWRIIFPLASCLKRQFGMEWEREGRSAYGIGVGGHGSKSAVLHQPYCRI